MNIYNTFESGNHLLPDLSKETFESLHDWDLAWEILEPINIAESAEDEPELVKRFSPGQKALYFFWYLDAQVTNGGFIQFYFNNYRIYLPAIMQGLELIGDTELLSLLTEADTEYLAQKAKFDKQIAKDDLEALYKEMEKFEELDDSYYAIHDNTIILFEKFIRLNVGEFVKLV